MATEAFVGSLLLAVFLFVMSIFVCVAFCGGSFLILWRHGKTFQFFLCHHKDGAGAFTRILKMRLQGDPRVTRQVFLDSDNLRDLKVLFGGGQRDEDTSCALQQRDFCPDGAWAR